MEAALKVAARFFEVFHVYQHISVLVASALSQFQDLEVSGIPMGKAWKNTGACIE